MMKWWLVLLAVLSFTAAAGAQEFPNEPYEFLLAKLAADDGHFDEALRHMDKVVAKNPGDPTVLYERAMMLIDAGNVSRAESELRNVVQTNPKFYDANRVLGRILLDHAGSDRAKLDEATKYLQAAYDANRDDLGSGMAVAQLLISANRLAEAERVLATLTERAPDQRSINYAYAQVLSKLGRGNESKPYLERAVQVDPTFVPAVMQLIEIYQAESEWRKAADLLQPLIEDDPMNRDLQRQQGFFYLRAGEAELARDRFQVLSGADPNDSRSAFYLAESLNDLEQYPEAEKIYRKLLQADPNDTDLLSSLGLSLSGQKRWDDAAATFNKLLAVPNAPENLTVLARTQLAFIDLQKENFSGALDKATRVMIFRDRPNTQAISIAVEALKREKRQDQIVGLLEPLALKFTNDPFLNSRYLEALVTAGQKEKAAQLAQAQAKLGTRNAIGAAEAFLQAGDKASALALMKSAAAAKPDDLDAQFQLGSVYERTGDRKSAEKTFLAILEKNPDHAPSLNYLGYMWAENNENLEQAHEMLTRAVGQEPNNGAYVDSLGWVYFRLGKLELAEKYLTDAAKLMPRDATVHEHLGDVMAKRGNPARALELYKLALTLDPEGTEVETLRTKIAALEQQTQTSQR